MNANSVSLAQPLVEKRRESDRILGDAYGGLRLRTDLVSNRICF
ncbi:MAG: hypothetical protein ACYTXA_05890 [Nostoc sp.]